MNAQENLTLAISCGGDIICRFHPKSQLYVYLITLRQAS